MNASPSDLPASAELLALAQRLIAKHHECFWFRHPEAELKDVGDVRHVIENLRNYGDRLAWYEAQDLQRCLSQYCNEMS